ncbi:hypothetical protein SmJEL517_g01795 [Synchytrium microbalum]|uniref:Sec20 C-terminal domain-containing protein n=1 Tax=Synchytrium microbalum TaxID=1806994 RepID=A0A507CER1_9FUNG|nr:uncharacterized protein SmJEL517_g01795 [Synchytrium microbalum]TPX36003.1 hypothetical protein SmJEL517_g01795 [Synchytrium microbalum]
MSKPRDVVQKKLDTLAKAEHLTKTLVDELTSQDGKLSTHAITEKSNKIRGLLQSIGRTVEQIKESAWEEDRESDTRLILRLLQPLEDEHEKLTGLSRKAIVTANRNAQLQAEADRQELMSKGTSEAAAERIKRLASKDSVISASNELTDSMREALKMMSEEVQKSTESAQVLASSTDTLAQTSDRYKVIDSVTDSSKRLVLSMSRRDLIDRGMIVFGLVVFLGVVLHIVRKRIWLPGDAFCTGKGYLC